MDSYRIYGLDATGHIRHGEYVDADGDAEAVRAAQRLLASHPGAEVWLGKRRVAGPAEIALHIEF